ncbi:hypothetical protein GMMP15_1530016 [Candidatus Magnetomoraceae bacterium gMMP-15]
MFKLIRWMIYLILLVVAGVVYIINTKEFQQYKNDMERKETQFKKESRENQKSNNVLDNIACRQPGSKAYLYFKSQGIERARNTFQEKIKGWAELSVLENNSAAKKIYVYVINIYNKNEFTYNKQQYMKGDKFWINANMLKCNPP